MIKQVMDVICIYATYREVNKRLTEAQITQEYQKSLKLEADFSEYFTGETVILFLCHARRGFSGVASLILKSLRPYVVNLYV